MAELVGQLRADIVQARYGADEPLRFRALANAYGAGVSTLRRRSRASPASTWWVSAEPGFRVAAVRSRDLIDIMQASSEIERVALRQSIDSGDDHWEAGIVAAHHRLLLTQSRLENGRSSEAAQEWEVRHREFHQALIAGCRSRWLIRFCEMLRIQCDRYRHLVSVPPSDYPRLVVHHAPLMEAALARDPDRACRLLATHVERSANVILAALGSKEIGRQRHRPHARHAARFISSAAR